MGRNSIVKLGNVPFSANSNTRYKVGKSATYSKTFSGCTYIRLTTSVKVQATPAEIDSYNFLEVADGDGCTVRGFITTIEYVNNLTSVINFKIDGWETYKGDVVFKTSYIERLSAGVGGSEYAYMLPEPYTSDRYTCYAETQYSISDYRYIVASLHASSPGFYTKVMEAYGEGMALREGRIDKLTAVSGTSLNGIYHGCCFIVSETVEAARKCVEALISSGYEASVLGVFAVPSALITANGTKAIDFYFTMYDSSVDFVGKRFKGTTIILSDTSIMCLLDTVTAPAITTSDMCSYKKIKNAPYTFLRVITPTGAAVDFDYHDFTDDTPEFAIYGAIGFNSEILLVPKNYLGIAYNFSKAISVQCNQTGMFSSNTYGAWASAQQLKYISTAISTVSNSIASALSQNYAGTLTAIAGAEMSALNYQQERHLASKSSIHTTGNVSNSDYSFCHPQSSCFRLQCMSLRPHDAASLSAYIDNYGYTVSEWEVPNTNFIEDDCYIKTNNVQLSVNCPDAYASEIRGLFNSGCRFI